ncbi:MAG: CPBP family intramembrane metalloprotease [Cyclobacteriaceae bacterium]|nr:CPBP family intramembrane metalloprotease [Cyclobacteriaceae bacterium]
MEQLKNLNSPSTTLAWFWMKVPLVVRSILIGFAVNTLGVGIWVILANNVPVPWSVVAMGAVLIIYWLYFRGKGAPSGTKEFRRFCTRQTSLKRYVWIWGVMAAFSIILLLHWGFVLKFRIDEFQPEIFKTAGFLNDYPVWEAWSMIVMASLVAGVCEEVGFRGYMQKPLEQKYGPVVGISITSLVFVVVHLHQVWASGILLGIFLISFIIGYLAYSTNSLLPGIIAHASFDVINFSYWWSDVAGTFEYKPVSITGVDNHFILTLMVLISSFVLFVVAIRQLLRVKESGVFLTQRTARFVGGTALRSRTRLPVTNVSPLRGLTLLASWL